MEAAPSSSVVAAPSETPVPAAPLPWQDTTRWLAPPADPSIALRPSPPSAWPRSAQATTVVLLVLSLSLLAWHALLARRGASRPTFLDPNETPPFRIDLNRASHAELLQLPGVGENLARRIEGYRDAQGGFRHVEELRRVSGIGPVLLEKLRPLVWVAERKEDEEELDQPPPVKPLRKETPTVQRAITGKEARLEAPIDLNRATAEELRRLPGIGPKLSERILEARRKEPFKTVDDLRRVPGIGPKTLANLRPYVTVGD